AVRAYWLEKPLMPRERSCIFGFTCDFPPTYEEVGATGKELGITPAARANPRQGFEHALGDARRDARDPARTPVSLRTPLELPALFAQADKGGGATPPVTGRIPSPVPPGLLNRQPATPVVAETPIEGPGGGGGSGGGPTGQPTGGGG